MKRANRLLAALLAMTMVLAYVPHVPVHATSDTASFAGGSGTATDPYLIETKEHLNNVRNNLSTHYKMIADIVFTEADFAAGGDFYNNGNGWLPIGTSTTSPFSGSFDGNGKSIKGLRIKITVSDIVYAGLFGCCSGGNITNLTMDGGSIEVKGSTKVYAGGICAYSANTNFVGCNNANNLEVIVHAESTGVEPYSYVGGISGYGGNCANCENSGNIATEVKVYNDDYDFVYCGGIVGGYSGVISNCTNYGNISAASTSTWTVACIDAGGIAGSTSKNISGCKNFGNISCSANNMTSVYAGGICGSFSGSSLELSYNAGIITGPHAGGIAGSLRHGVISNCFNLGEIISSDYAGGITGYVTYNGEISSCYNVGIMNGSDNSVRIGGITGYMSSGISANCYYIDTISSGTGRGSATTVKMSADEMQQSSAYTGFDFTNVWEFKEKNLYLYPTLNENPYWDGEFAGGEGTEADPYLIKTKDHLNNVRNYLDAHYKMIANIVFSDEDFAEGGDFYNTGSGFIPIGSKDEAFYGSFDGNGYSISNLLIYNSATTGDAYAGLFAINNGVIKNLGIENGNISVYPDSNQYAYCGSIAGKNLGTIADCYNTGNVWSRRYAGGIAAYNSGTILDCYNNGTITASKEFDLSAGGIAGYNYDGTISNCYNSGQISSSAIVVSTFTTTYSALAGGIVGYGYDGTIEKCYNTGDINATSNVTITENSDAYAAANSGGIIGSNRSCSISECYNIGAISADTTADGHWYDTAKSYAGGIAGSNASGIGSCYNVGTLTTTSSTGHNYPGGIAGNNSGNISTSYNIASGIENIASNNSGTIKNCYFHSETLSAGCKLASLFSVLTYQGFNFESVWQMSDGNYPLPVLRSVKNYASFEYAPEENAVDFASGKGTEADPFVIKTIVHLDNIRKYPSSYFVLANDITFDPENEAFAIGWKPFAFKGYIDGQGYKIAGISITVSNTLEYQWRDPGLFSSNDGTIKNLTIEDMRISVSNMGDKYGGFICAVNNGVIINCHSKSCTISLQNIYHFFGGIAGNNSGSIQNCTSNNTINWGANGGRIGGITANNTGSISGCTNNSMVTNIGSYTPISGGISAQNSGDIIGSNNLAPILTQSTYSQRNGYSGGIVGQMTGGKISQCYSTGNITTEATEYKGNTYSGGVVAYISGGDVIDCYNTGDIYGEPNSSSASCYVGGIVGYNNTIGTIKNCYSIGENSGSASSSNLYVGYVCGFNASNTIENCYYLGVANNGSGSGDFSAMYGENVTALKDQSTYVGFDFTNTWTASGNSDYPFPELAAVPMIYEKEVKAIQIDSLPSKLKYIQNYDSLDVEGGTLKVAYEYDEYEVIPLSEASVSGFDNSVVGKQTIYVSYAGKTCSFEIEIEEMPYGDVNSDGMVDTLDRMILSRYLANWDEYDEDSISMAVADVNGDGVVDTLDRMILNRHLANWEGYESLPNAG